MRIQHIQITSPPEQEEACRTFYGEVLGLEEIPKPEPLQVRGGAWYRVGELELHLGVEAGADAGTSKRHMCFQVDDLTALRTRLVSAGHPIEDATPIEGLVRFFTRDPAGNKIELAEPC